MFSTVCTRQRFVLRGGERRSACLCTWREPIAALSTRAGPTHAVITVPSLLSLAAPIPSSLTSLPPLSLRPPGLRHGPWPCKRVQGRCRVPAGQLGEGRREWPRGARGCGCARLAPHRTRPLPPPHAGCATDAAGGADATAGWGSSASQAGHAAAVANPARSRCGGGGHGRRRAALGRQPGPGGV
jgi:hypothetical protein